MSGFIFNYDGKVEQAPTSRDIGGLGGMDVEELESYVQQVYGLPPGVYDFFDEAGKIDNARDFSRAALRGDCEVKVKEKTWHIVQRENTNNIKLNKDLLDRTRKELVDSEDRSTNRTQVVREELTAMIKKLELQISQRIMPTIEDLCRDRSQLQKETRQIMEKLSGINVQELRDISAQATSLHEEVKAAVKRVDKIDASFHRDKAIIFEDVRKNEQDLRELQRYMQGKVDICIDADADLRHQQQLLNERGQILADDLRLLQEDLRHLTQRTSGALEESEDLRTLLGQVREDNRYLGKESGEIRTRIHCIEGAASEKWAGFAPGVMYFRRWHPTAKGSDVQLDAELKNATGRGFMAAMGVVIGNSEGLVLADGPCRRFGTPGHWASYFEIQLEEISHAPAGAGGLYVGYTLQSPEEINEHPRKEFDGWLIGGPGKALICRRSSNLDEDDLNDIEKIPATFGSKSGEGVDMQAVHLLRRTLPPRAKGEVREVESSWSSEGLRMNQKIGVLFSCHRDGGARLRVSVEGQVVCTHEFIDAPPAEAVGFLTPCIRLAGTGKSALILPGQQAPAKMLAD